MIPLVKVAMPPKEQLMPELEKVLYSGMIAEGEYVYKFEAEFAEKFNIPVAMSTSSGTAALHMALVLSGVESGDEVITTSMTAEPTNTVILQSGGTPVFADIDAETGNLCPLAVKAVITSKTKAIVVVHYAGFPADLHGLRKLADEHGISLIEDCAHALGARYAEQAIGTIGDYGIFSFQAIKHMTTVDGGMLTMRDKGRLDEAKRLRWFGMTKGVARTEVDIKKLGYKYNMHNVAAVIGLAQLKGIQVKIDRHIENGKFFDQEISKISGLTINNIDKKSQPSYWLYTVLSDRSDDLERCLQEAGVMASKLHRPNHLHTIFSGCRGPLPQLAEYYRRMLHIPCGWWVTNDEREKIVNALKAG